MSLSQTRSKEYINFLTENHEQLAVVVDRLLELQQSQNAANQIKKSFRNSKSILKIIS
ncbi:hypothetical protein [Desulfovibrio sp. DV]|uniref:hypothetical protein n=1 Tax=Desulfovibrio sp. DV TaxID=1844708 RepID=UPI00158819D4|nr:hypothetical protein [Desulfovibrio sp. DV]